MSRTDVHRPWDVQLKDPYNRHLLYRFQVYSTEPPQLVPYKNIGCGCRMCTSYYWRKWENKSRRVQWRKERQDMLKDLRVGGT